MILKRLIKHSRAPVIGTTGQSFRIILSLLVEAPLLGPGVRDFYREINKF